MLSIVPFVLILIVGALYALNRKKLTIAATVTGVIIATLIFAGSGYIGFIMMTTFFVLGTAATSHKRLVKQQLGLAQPNKGRRSTNQVLANAGFQGFIGLLMLVDAGHSQLYFLMIAAGFSSATADTISSEFGSVYGSRFYNIINFRNDERGLDGVISLEGTLAGLAGSIIIALLYAVTEGLGKGMLIVIIAGTAGNLFDSVLGATLERKRIFKNDAVNLLNTIFAALVAWVLN